MCLPCLSERNKGIREGPVSPGFTARSSLARGTRPASSPFNTTCGRRVRPSASPANFHSNARAAPVNSISIVAASATSPTYDPMSRLLIRQSGQIRGIQPQTAPSSSSFAGGSSQFVTPVQYLPAKSRPVSDSTHARFPKPRSPLKFPSSPPLLPHPSATPQPLQPPPRFASVHPIPMLAQEFPQSLSRLLIPPHRRQRLRHLPQIES